MHIADVVVVDWNRSRNYDPKVFQQPSKKYGFIVVTIAPLYSTSVLDKAIVS